MITFLKDDGQIEVGFSGCCCPPGQRREGMHTNSSTSWWRINSEPWVNTIHPTGVRILAEAAESCEDFLTAARTENV